MIKILKAFQLRKNGHHPLGIGYDIIGDVHGYADELELMLRSMDYTDTDGIWRHAHRKAIFVGDFIHRGPKSKSVIAIVRKMVEFGSAFAILGNHEINAILYFTKSKGFPLHEPSASARQLLTAFQLEYLRQDDQLDDDIKWLRSLPLYLDFNRFRVVHAYWNEQHIEVIREIYLEGRLRKSILKDLAARKEPVFKAITEVTRGIEVFMPSNLVIKDNKHLPRNSFRIKWWKSMENQTFKEMSFGGRFELPAYTIPKEICKIYPVYTSREPLLFVGHYCVGAMQQFQTDNVCCVDACIANGGKLCAYRYYGESKWNRNHLVYVEKVKVPLTVKMF